MTDKHDRTAEAKEAPRCGDTSQTHRLTCDRPEGHVRSAGSEDWHEATSHLETEQHTSDWAVTVNHDEIIRWAPHSWDIPGADPKEAL